MKYFNVEKFDKTGLVKTVMVPKDQARWRIYSYNAKDDMHDLVYYNELAKSFDITPDDMIRIPQQHSKNIFVAKKKDAGTGVTKMEIDGMYDGVITNKKNMMLLTVEADCTPVYILDYVNKAVGMIHSGWRGTVNKITENAIDLMAKNYGSKKENILIHFGPAICGKCYEVGADLIPEFEKILNLEEIHKVFTPIANKPDKYYLDVTKGIRLSLIKYGIDENNITKSMYCTYHDNIFDSWRKTKDKTKQMVTGIMLV